MKKTFIPLIFLFAVIIFNKQSHAQTATQALSQAVKYYNTMRDYEDNLKPESVTLSDIDSLMSYIEKAIPLIDIVNKSGTADEIKTVQYFNANFQYELGFIYGMMGKNQEAYNVLSKIESVYEKFSNSNEFPLKYIYEEKNYSVKYDNFSPTLAEYYTGMAEICANLSKHDESLKWSKKSLAFPATTGWYRYISLNKVMEVKKKLGVYDQEFLDCSIQQLEALTQLDTSYLRTIKENNYPTEKTSFPYIVTIIDKNSSLLNNGEPYRKALPYLIKRDNKDLIMECYARAVVTGVRENSFLFNAAEHFLSDPANPAYTQKISKPYLAEKAADDLYSKLPTLSNCSDWLRLKSIYDKLSKTDKAKQCQKYYDDCNNKYVKEQRKQNRRSSRFGTKLYLGIYPLPYLWGNYGATASFMFEKMWLDISYTMVNKDRDYMSDFGNLFDTNEPLTDGTPNSREKVYWDGTRIQGALKFPVSEQSDMFTYVGLIGGYTTKKYQPFVVRVVDANTFLIVDEGTISPDVKKYSGIFTFGVRMISKKRFVLDYGFGIGASYSTFNINTKYFDNPQYIIESHLVQNAKPQGFGFAAYLNFSLGFYLGKKY